MSLKELLSGLRTEREELASTLAALRTVVGADNTAAGPVPLQLKAHEHYRLFRDYIQHEDDLINNRLLWNINVQGFLFATFGLAVQRIYEAAQPAPAPVLLHAIITILPVFGISVSTLSLVSVRAAEEAIQSLRGHWEKILVNYPEAKPYLPGIIGGGLDSSHKSGLRAPFVVPIVFMAAWFFLLVASTWHLYKLAAAGKPIL